MTDFWTTVHTKAFRSLQTIEDVSDLDLQAVGIDRIIHTATRSITVEEKTDRYAPKNLCFELEGNRGCNGWALKPQLSDMFVYGYINHRVAYYFDTTALFETFTEKYSEWFDSYTPFRISSHIGSALVMLVPLDQVTSVVQHKEIHV